MRKSGRAGGRLRRPFPVRMGFMSKQNRSARSQQKTTRSHPRLPDPRREVFGVFPSISRRPRAGGEGGGASPPDRVRERAPKPQRGPQRREPPPSPPLGGGRADTSSPAAGSGRSGGRILPPLRPAPPPRARGRLRARPPRRERSRRDLSRPPLPGSAQSRPGPGLPRRPSRGPARTGAAVKSHSQRQSRHFPAGRRQGRTHGTRGGDKGGGTAGGQLLSSRESCWFGFFFSCLRRELHSNFLKIIIFYFPGISLDGLSTAPCPHGHARLRSRHAAM